LATRHVDKSWQAPYLFVGLEMVFNVYKKTFLVLVLSFLSLHGSQDSDSDSYKSFNFPSGSVSAIGLELSQQSFTSNEKIETDQSRVLHTIMTELDNLHLSMDLNFVALRAMINQVDQKVAHIEHQLKKLESTPEKKSRCVSFDETSTKKN
jgi:hypothetical protein